MKRLIKQSKMRSHVVARVSLSTMLLWCRESVYMSNVGDIRAFSLFLLRLSLSFCPSDRHCEQTDTDALVLEAAVCNDDSTTIITLQACTEKGRAPSECCTMQESRLRQIGACCFYSSQNWLAPRLIPQYVSLPRMRMTIVVLKKMIETVMQETVSQCNAADGLSSS